MGRFSERYRLSSSFMCISRRFYLGHDEDPLNVLDRKETGTLLPFVAGCLRMTAWTFFFVAIECAMATLRGGNLLQKWRQANGGFHLGFCAVSETQRRANASLSTTNACHCLCTCVGLLCTVLPCFHLRVCSVTGCHLRSPSVTHPLRNHSRPRGQGELYATAPQGSGLLLSGGGVTPTPWRAEHLFFIYRGKQITVFKWTPGCVRTCWKSLCLQFRHILDGIKVNAWLCGYFCMYLVLSKGSFVLYNFQFLQWNIFFLE